MMLSAFESEWGTEFDAQSSLTVVYVTSKLYYDTRSHLGAQEALQRAYRVCSARLCKKRHKGVHLGLDPVACSLQARVIQNVTFLRYGSR